MALEVFFFLLKQSLFQSKQVGNVPAFPKSCKAALLPGRLWGAGNGGENAALLHLTVLLLTAQFLQPFKPSEAPSPSSSKGYFQVLQPELCGWVQVLVPTPGQGGFWSALSPLKLPGMLPQHPLFQAVVTETEMLVQEGIAQGTLNGWEGQGASVTP